MAELPILVASGLHTVEMFGCEYEDCWLLGCDVRHCLLSGKDVLRHSLLLAS